MLATICVLDPGLVSWLVYSSIKATSKHSFEIKDDIAFVYLHMMQLLDNSYDTYEHVNMASSRVGRKNWVKDSTSFAETEVHN